MVKIRYNIPMTIGRKRRAVLIFAHALFVAVLVVGAVAIAGPLTYDDQAHQTFNTAVRRWSRWGDQLIGLDLTAPRQNIFSLALDLDRRVVIVDHGATHSSHLLGPANFITRGSLYTVADVLRWFDIPLTTGQARRADICRPLDGVRDDQPIVIQPDPYQYGIASWYGPGFHGRMAASGEIYNMYDRTAAHRTLPLQSLVRVIATHTGASTIVRINDRGPYVGGRVIDLSYHSKQSLGMDGLAAVYLELLDPHSLDAECNNML